MLKALSTSFLQHLLAQNSWANALLQPYAGKAVQFDIASIKANIIILEDGGLAIAGETNIADATVCISASLILRLIAQDEAAKMQIVISGDTHLATEFAKVLSNMRWDYEDDLSKLVGDVSALKISQLGREAVSGIKRNSIQLAEMLSEYWQEEKPLIAKKRHVEKFNAEVDTLRADVARFEKRLTKLTQQQLSSHHQTTDSSH
ncbi:MAG: SCP2 sterol-binding domain-containing protein [Methylophilales bacterium]|nr:SCP2 sterol-binding domain-containing protein [Methylophilales bacterium]